MLTFIAAALLSCQAQAADLPKIQAPAGFDEGTQTTLDASQIADILPWAKNSELALRDLLDYIRPLGLRESKEALVRGIESVVLASAPKGTETLMRYTLNRAL